MGNFHSNWFHRHTRSEPAFNQEETDNRVDNTSSEALFGTSPSNLDALHERYSFRRTVARLRRSLSHSGTAEGLRNLETANDDLGSGAPPYRSGNVTNNSTSSVDSVSSRRRRREELDEGGEEREENESRRRRLENLERTSFTSGTGDESGNSLFFYFALPNESEPTAAAAATTTNSNSIDNTPRRRSSRLQRAAEYIRGRLRHTSQGSVSNPLGEVEVDRPMVLVRIRHLPANRSSTPPSMETENESLEVSSVLQWTIYFVIPRDDDDSIPATPFDADVAVRRAFAVLRAMASGENMNYEDWSRLQEMMGVVSRGVAKELIEQQLPAKIFSSSLNIGISCPICLSDYEGEESVRTLPCTHSYHAHCIDTWLVSCNNCPLCRHPPITVQN